MSKDVLDTLIAEAGSDPEGLRAVAWVIQNRATQWGMTPEQVVRQKGQFEGYYKPGPKSVEAQKSAKVRAKAEAAWNDVVSGKAPDPTNGGTSFRAKGTKQPAPNGTVEIAGNVFALGSARPNSALAAIQAAAPTPMPARPPTLSAFASTPTLDPMRSLQDALNAKAERIRAGTDTQTVQKAVATPQLPRVMPPQIASQRSPQTGMLHPFDPAVNQPRPNPDGSVSTELSRTVQFPDGSWANVPSLWWSKGSESRDFGSMGDDQLGSFAQRYEQQSGKKFPRYTSLQSAEAAAKSRSNAGGGTQGAMTQARGVGTSYLAPATKVQTVRIDPMTNKVIAPKAPLTRTPVTAQAPAPRPVSKPPNVTYVPSTPAPTPFQTANQRMVQSLPVVGPIVTGVGSAADLVQRIAPPHAVAKPQPQPTTLPSVIPPAPKGYNTLTGKYETMQPSTPYVAGPAPVKTAPKTYTARAPVRDPLLDAQDEKAFLRSRQKVAVPTVPVPRMPMNPTAAMMAARQPRVVQGPPPMPRPRPVLAQPRQVQQQAPARPTTGGLLGLLFGGNTPSGPISVQGGNPNITYTDRGIVNPGSGREINGIDIAFMPKAVQQSSRWNTGY